MGRERIAVIYGPTGIGKTSLSIEIAQACGAEIISADSMAVYRQMDVGTAKPTVEERQDVVHHLIDVVDPDEAFSAKDFRLQSQDIIADCAKRGVPVLVVGGTGLYVRALVHGLFEGPEADLPLRQAFEAEEDAQPGVLHARLTEVDPVTAGRVHANDRVRVIRALEIHTLTGQTQSALIAAHQFQEKPYDTLKIGMVDERAALVERIEKRVDQMMADGLKAEVEGLLAAGYDRGLKSMNALGYQHLVAHLMDGISLAETIRLLKRDHRRYSRRQMTWMRGEPEVQQISRLERELIKAKILAFLT